MVDNEGTNGLNFVSARDPQLLLDSALVPTCDNAYYGLSDATFYYPEKFGNPAPVIPLATGLEARLIEAEGRSRRATMPDGWRISTV